MTFNTTSIIANLQERVINAKLRKSQLEANRVTTECKLDEVTKIMEESFGVTDLDTANSLLKSLEAEVANYVIEATSLLDEIEAS